MNSFQRIMVFGEVLFDCFPSGEEVLGGAPFNVAWHLQALGAHPLFISRIGADEQGQRILAAMKGWGMQTAALQLDTDHATGRVEVEIIGGQPRYHISKDVAYDFISSADLPAATDHSILYHGTLVLRQTESRQALEVLAGRKGCALFVDVNLRTPWWKKEEVLLWLARARWAKMNADELADLGFTMADLETAMAELMQHCSLTQLIVTRGADGALVRTGSGEMIPAPAPPIKRYIDTVGAGDAFSAVYLHGLLTGRPIEENLVMAQQMAATVIGMRGAIPTDKDIYNRLTTAG